MRSALIAAAFAASVIAVPYHKRDVVTDTDVEVAYATEIITVTAALPSSDAVSPETTDASSSSLDYRHHRYRTTQTTSASPVAPKSTSVASTVRAPTTSSTVSRAPTTTSTSTRPTSTSVVSAPVSTKTTTTSIAPSSTSTKATTTSIARASTTSTSTSTSTSVAAASTSAAASAVPTTYAQIAVYHHNIHRSNHSAADVVWDNGIASTAASIAASCVYAHNVTAGGGGYGQNIAAGVQSNNISAIITDLFYNGEVGWYDNLYGQEQPDMTNFEHWGHFSQIVWKGTTKIGCATQDCTSSGLANVGSNVAPYFTVCNYEAPGNYANEYGDNIGSPLNYPTAEWNAGLS